MSRSAQPTDVNSTGSEHDNASDRANRSASSTPMRLGCCLTLAISLTACGSMSMNSAEDIGLTTGSVPRQQPKDTQLASDQSIIRNAVSAADLNSVGQGGVSWANTDTGSRGAISSITEYAEAGSGSTCRKFVVSREAYNGVNLYDGDACLVNGGAWQLRQFKGM